MPKKKKRVHNKSTGRDYTYDKAYNKRTVKDRVERNKARRQMRSKLTKKYGKSKAASILRGKDVDHIRPIKSGGKTTKKNIRLIAKSKNRARK
jgi:5-methylcytosine-specific restriction endonuclease McrA